jgi:hypothetical protein
MKGSAQTTLSTGTVRTPFGAIKVSKGLPATAAEVTKLFDQLDFQQATQAYLWALPIVSWTEWQATHADVFGATDHDIVLYANYDDRLGILTANATTPYMIAFGNLKKSGPMVVDLPPGPVAGGLGDFWQREGAVLGEMGPDKGEGGKALILGPGVAAPADVTGYRVVSSTTVNFMFGLRALDPDPAKAMALIKQVRIYRYSTRSTPPATRLVTPGGKKWFGGPPRGMDYWKRLHQVLQDEVIDERDRFYMAALANLGIEKGKPFKPNARQKKILLEGATTGELMAQCNSFAKRFSGSRHWPDRRWVYLLEMEDSSQRTANFDQLLERAAYTYEAVGYSNAMMSKTPGLGQAYLAAYTDKSGAWLDGGKNYTLHVPAQPPAKNFWSATVYDSGTRCLIDNKQGRGDRGSRDAITVNADGSVNLFFGPKAPKSGEDNWVQTIPGRPWFLYFRFYGPLEAYFDKSWKLPDIERAR